MNILRAVLATHVVDAGRRSYMVAPPSCYQALTLLHTAIAVSEGDANAFDDFKRTAREWLPLGLFLQLFPPRWMFWRRIAVSSSIELTLKLIQLGAPEPDPELNEKPLPGMGRQKTDDDIDPQEAFRKTNWDAVIADVAFHFNLSPQGVLEMRWPMFVLMMRQADAMRARWELSYISSKGLPYIESETKRDKAFDELQIRAGYKRRKTNREILEEQKRQLAEMKTSMQRIGLG